MNQTQKRACKYCGQIHKYMPFTDCHPPNKPLPDSLQEGYREIFGDEE